jgi:hypothetical protein
MNNAKAARVIDIDKMRRVHVGLGNVERQSNTVVAHAGFSGVEQYSTPLRLRPQP